MDVCAVFHVVLPRKKKGEERVGVGGRGKCPGAPPHKGKKRKKPTARYLIDQYGEKGKAKKKKIQEDENCHTSRRRVFGRLNFDSDRWELKYNF
jgi:hypothetical protein